MKNLTAISPSEWSGRLVQRTEDDLSGHVSDCRTWTWRKAIDRCHGAVVDNREPHLWTDISRDEDFFEQMIILHLTWIHPMCMLVNEARFLASFRDSSGVYCSPALVNAICAMSRHVLRTTWNNDQQTKDAIDFFQSRFVDETVSLMKSADCGKMTAIQTYAITFLVELGSRYSLIAFSLPEVCSRTLDHSAVEAEEIDDLGSPNAAHVCFRLQQNYRT